MEINIKNSSHKQDSVDTTIEFRTISHLGILAPHNLSALRHQTQLTHIDFQHRSLRNNTQISIQGRLRVLFDAQNGKLERGLQFRVSNIGLLETQTGRTDKAFIFRGFTGEILTNKGNFVNSSFPRFF